MEYNLFIDEKYLDYNKNILTEDIEDRIEELDHVIQSAKQDDFNICYTSEIYSAEILKNKILSELLYEPNSELCNDKKEQLRLILDRCKLKTQDELIEIKESKLGAPIQDEVNVLFQFYGENENNFFIKMKEEYHTSKYENLINCHDIDFYLEICKKIFYNIIFKEEIKKDIQTLSLPFNEYCEKVSYHLNAINFNLIDIFKTRNGEALPALLKKFGSDSSIKCTNEGDQIKVRKKLTFSFQINEETKKYKCEPHTKLEGSTFDGSGPYKYDRIYFNTEYLFNDLDLVLIGYIGKHL